MAPHFTAPLLMSPIHLSRSEFTRSSFVECLNTSYASKASISAPSRKSNNIRRVPTIHRDTPHHHRKQSSRPCCQFGSVGVSMFDQLPWISVLDQPQENMRDMADLSQLPAVIHERSEVPSSGPVRRRRNSPRSNPLAPVEDIKVSLAPFPFRDPLPDAPSTPRSPSRSHDRPPRVRFHQLMPILRPSKCGKGLPSILSVT